MDGPRSEESLIEFAFVSSASPGLPAAAVLRIARQSRSFNTCMGLTGVMRFADGRFEQTIEGRCTLVLPLAARILGDPRHRSIRITAFRPIVARRFAEWSLAGFDVDAALPDATICAFARAAPPPVLQVRPSRA